MAVRHSLAVAAALTAAQVVLAAATSGQADPVAAWRSLYRFDGDWFAFVATRGYHLPAEPTRADPGNTAFYPAYPLLAAGLMRLTGVDAVAALLAVAPLAAVGFWTYLLLLLRRAGVSPRGAVALAGLFACHPAAIFLVASYSESTFLFGLAGFVYWCDRDRPAAAAAHGVLMTAARLVGLPAVVYPLLRAAVRRRGWGRAAVVGLVAALGGVGFMAYLWWRFGRWDAPAVSHAAGWDVQPDWWAFVRFRTWGLKYAEILDCWHDAEALSRLVVPVSVGHFLILGAAELFARRQGVRTAWRDRLPLYLIALALFALPVVAHATRGMSSMVRFAVCWHAVLVVALAGVLADRPAWGRAWWVRGVLAAGGLWGLSVQLALAWKFTRGEFVG